MLNLTPQSGMDYLQFVTTIMAYELHQLSLITNFGCQHFLCKVVDGVLVL